MRVRLVHDFGGEEKTLDAEVTTSGIFVHWPTSGMFQVYLRTGRLGPTNTKPGRWRVHTEDWPALKAELSKVRGNQWEFRPVAQSVPHPDR